MTELTHFYVPNDGQAMGVTKTKTLENKDLRGIPQGIQANFKVSISHKILKNFNIKLASN